MTPDPEIMPKAMQIATLKRIFKQLNPWADEGVVDWEAYVDAEVELPGNIATMETRYPEFIWRREEEVSPEIIKLREVEARRRELEKERKEHLKKIEAHEKVLRSEVERVVSEEIGSLKEELEDLKAQRERVPEASLEEIGELRKGVERTTERLHEMDILLVDTYKKLREAEKEKRRILPTIEIPTGPETRICQCGREFIIKNIFLEDKFVKLAIRSRRLSDFAGTMIRRLCGECQRAQYGNTLLGLVCKDAIDGIITGDRIREVGLSTREFMDICSSGGVPIPPGWII